MRGTVDDLLSPHPLERALPGMFQGDDFTCRFVSAFDVVVAPVFSTLDNLAAYLDPDTAPEDFLDWLAGWFGLDLDATWAMDRRRAAVRDIVELYRWRGTARGLQAQLALQLGADTEVDVDDGGGVSWSPVPGSDLPGAASEQVVVRVRVADPGTVDLGRVEAMVRAVTPAHLVAVVELSPLVWTAPPTTKGGGGGGKTKRAPKAATDDTDPTVVTDEATAEATNEEETP